MRDRRIGLAAQVLFGVYLVAMNLHSARAAWTRYGGGAPKSPLYGIWDIEQMAIDGRHAGAYHYTYLRSLAPRRVRLPDTPTHSSNDNTMPATEPTMDLTATRR